MIDKIPKEIINELKLKRDRTEINQESRIIVEKHQASIKIPARIRTELNLKEGSIKCSVIIKNNKELLIKIKE